MKKTLMIVLSSVILAACAFAGACGNKECKEHSYGDWSVTTEATCTTDGLKTRECTKCHQSETEVIPQGGHLYGDWAVTTEATCTTDGLKTRECTKCHRPETEVIPQGGHLYGDWVNEVSATCTDPGVKGHYYCSVCKKYFDADKKELGSLAIDATGHDFKDHVCQNCGTSSFSQGLEFTLVGEEYSVTGIGTCVDTDIVIPTSYNDKPVTSIGDDAFRNCDKLTGVTIPSSIKIIGKEAFFGCVSLTKINYNATECEVSGDINSTTGEGFNVFNSVGRATDGITVTVGANVKKIPMCLFFAYIDEVSSAPNITAVVFEENSVCESIGIGAFIYCIHLKSIELPKSLTSIGEMAFGSCMSLTSITIPDSVASIGEMAFYGCFKLVEVINKSSLDIVKGSEDNGYVAACALNVKTEGSSDVVNVGDYLFYTYEGTNYLLGYVGNKTDLVLPDKYNKQQYLIHNCAFFYGTCTSLTSVTIPDSVTSIGEMAFYGLESLTSVTIGNGVTSIADSAFSYCPIETANIPAIAISCIKNDKLKTVTITSGDSIADSALKGCTSLKSVTIGNGVTSIGKDAFKECTALTNVTIGDGVTSIGEDAFDDCSKLTSVNYTGTIDQWVQIAFSDYSSNPLYYAKKLYINNELVTNANITTATKISDYAFEYYTALTSITIPDSVTSIGYDAFIGCYKLVEVINKSELNIKGGVAYYALNVKTEGVSDIVNVDDYLFLTLDGTNYLIGYVGNKTDLVLPDKYNGQSYEINKCAFYNCTSLTSVTIPDSVTLIDNGVFCNCSALTSITIGNGVTSIGSYAFYNCSSLTSINIPNSVTSIGSSAFYGCNELIVKDNGVCYVDNWVIGADSSITSAKIKDGTRGIADYAFEDCSSLTSVTIPDGVTSIGENAFYRCTSLTSVTIPDSVTSIGYDAFEWCTALTSVTIGNAVTSIGEDAFYGCESLTSITIPASVTSIGERAFYDCTALTSIIIGSGVTSIGYRAFDNCTSLESVNYTGTIDQWVQINFSDDDSNPLYYAKKLYINNELVTNANITTATKISDYAFYNCTSLTSVTIPDSVTSIGDHAFYGCLKLVEVINKSSLNITKGSYDNGYLAVCALNVKTEGTSDIVNVDDYLFLTVDDTNYLIGYVGDKTDLVLPDKYNKQQYVIHNYAFIYSVLLKSIAIPNGITSIGEMAFYNCESLTSVTIGNSVTSIGGAAFSDCTALTSITIPDSVTSIGNSAFYGCSALTSVYYKGTQSEWNKISIGSFGNYNLTARLYYYSETQPTTLGNYWHYNTNGEIVVWENK